MLNISTRWDILRHGQWNENGKRTTTASQISLAFWKSLFIIISWKSILPILYIISQIFLKCFFLNDWKYLKIVCILFHFHLFKNVLLAVKSKTIFLVLNMAFSPVNVIGYSFAFRELYKSWKFYCNLLQNIAEIFRR